jgi:hypothetical protein
VNDVNAIEGNDTAAYIAEIQWLESQGAPIDGIGVQGHFLSPINPRDVESRLNSLGQFGLPIWVTEFDTANADPNQRANQMETLYREAFSNPNVQGILMWGFWAGSQWRGPDAAMVNLDWTLNADGQRYEDLMHEWTTIADGATNAAGNLDFHGFAGTYDITVAGPGVQTTVQHVTLGPGTATNRYTITVQLAAPRGVTNIVASSGDNDVNLSWAAVVGASSYNILRGTSSGGDGNIPIQTGVVGTSYADTGAVNGVTYYYQIVAVNGAGASPASAEVIATPTPPPVSTTPFSLWGGKATPAARGWFRQSAELGMKFRTDVGGLVTSVMFYNPGGVSGPYVVHLWSASGALLATATATGGSAGGWQQIKFATPVAIKANTTYIASYTSSRGVYAFNSNYFSRQGVTSGPLHALAVGVDGSNGVFALGAGRFPKSSIGGGNFWVDVGFVPNANTSA